MSNENELFKIFSTLSEAITVIEKGRAVYLNPAAKELFRADEENLCLEVFPELLITDVTSARSGIINLNGKNIPAIASPLNGFTVVSLFPEKDDPNIDGNLFITTGRALGDALNTAKTSASVIRNHIEDIGAEDTLKYMAALDHSLFTLDRISGNLSAMHEFECTEFFLQVSCFDIAEHFEALCDAVRHMAKSRRISVTFKAEADRILFCGDKGKITRLLLNLFSNSLKFTPEGGKITLSIKPIGSDGVILSLKDTGVGMTSDTLRSVFSHYTKAPDLTKPKSGIGLGLSIVQHIASLHQGSAVIESRPNAGTTVSVFLKSQPMETVLHSTTVTYNAGSNLDVFRELSDATDYTAYLARYLD